MSESAANALKFEQVHAEFMLRSIESVRTTVLAASLQGQMTYGCFELSWSKV